jgi:type I restriction enzyme M protein
VAIFLARQGKSKEEIKKHIVEHYYKLDFSIDEIRPTYKFNETCQDTVPQAVEAFFESTSFEDAIRIAISVGGDSDTLACITGGIAEAYYGLSEDMKGKAERYLEENLFSIVKKFESKYPTPQI